MGFSCAHNSHFVLLWELLKGDKNKKEKKLNISLHPTSHSTGPKGYILPHT